MKYTIICGSHRKNSESLNVGLYLKHQIEKNNEDEVIILDLGSSNIPLWEESIWEGDPKWDKIWGEHSRNLSESEAIIIVTPEWNGMVTPTLKNFFLLCSSGELAHKPGFIVSISGGRGGTYPVSELRMSSYKNTYLCYIPDHIILQHVSELFKNFEKSDSKEEEYLRDRIDYSLSLLKEYAKSMNLVRSSQKVDLQTYPYGM
jgi:NAD(P)H-dependent FMN reductase